MLSTPIAAGKPGEERFAERVVAWQRRHGRHDLPWQGSRDPYRIWLAEIMLQQTQVATVIPYYRRFLARFPDVAALAAAPAAEVMSLWSGLGYYARARHLHRAAQEVVSRHGGAFPAQAARLAALPGIGRSTAAAVAAFAWGHREAILDGNVKRVLARHFGVAGYPGHREVETALWALAGRLLPVAGIEAYTQGLMDLGAGVCLRARPLCERCPLAAACVARREGRSAELPAPRPPRATPQRECVVLVILSEAGVLLEDRPPAGIWGGLASLPECPAADADLAGAVAALCGSRPAGLAALSPLRHAFSHFTLTLRPVAARVAPPFALAGEAACRWHGLDTLAAAPLPAPIRRILARLPAS